jgi:Double zinc ribbon
MHCTNCDSTNHNHANFCSSCGTKLADAPAFDGETVNIGFSRSRAPGVWRDKTDEELVAAALRRSDYTAEVRQMLQEELDRLRFADWPKARGRC